MKVGFFSDAHFEFRQPHPKLIFNKADPGDVLIVAGDLTMTLLLHPRRNDADARSVKKALESLRVNVFDQYKYVLYIMGNHEHYHNLIEESKPTIQEHFGPKVIVMDNNMIEIDDTVFVGGTLWSDFENGNPTSMNICEYGMNDYRLIYRIPGAPRAITSEFILEEHKKSKAYIESVVKAHPDKKVVVATHHGPTYKSLCPQHVGNGLDGAYASDLSNLILDNPNITHWIHGHTHMNVDYAVGSCRVLANQVGYSYEPSYHAFEGVKQFEV